jgi:hypothetical protein
LIGIHGSEGVPRKQGEALGNAPIIAADGQRWCKFNMEAGGESTAGGHMDAYGSEGSDPLRHADRAGATGIQQTRRMPRIGLGGAMLWKPTAIQAVAGTI